MRVLFHPVEGIEWIGPGFEHFVRRRKADTEVRPYFEEGADAGVGGAAEQEARRGGDVGPVGGDRVRAIEAENDRGGHVGIVRSSDLCIGVAPDSSDATICHRRRELT